MQVRCKRGPGRPPENRGGRDVVVYLYPEQVAKLERIADRREVSVSALVRKLIDRARG